MSLPIIIIIITTELRYIFSPFSLSKVFFPVYLLTCALKYCRLDDIVVWEVVAMTKRGRTMTKKEEEEKKTRKKAERYRTFSCFSLSFFSLALSRFISSSSVKLELQRLLPVYHFIISFPFFRSYDPWKFSNVCVWTYRNRKLLSFSFSNKCRLVQ